MPAAFDLVNFLDDLAKWLRGNTADAGTPRQLWTPVAIEASATPCYTVLAPYGGNAMPANVPLQQLSLQLMTTSPTTDAAAGLRQATTYYDRLLDDQRRPARGLALDRFAVAAVLNLRGPGVVGRDEKQRILIATNFDVQAYATA